MIRNDIYRTIHAIEYHHFSLTTIPTFRFYVLLLISIGPEALTLLEAALSPNPTYNPLLELMRLLVIASLPIWYIWAVAAIVFDFLVKWASIIFLGVFLLLFLRKVFQDMSVTWHIVTNFPRRMRSSRSKAPQPPSRSEATPPPASPAEATPQPASLISERTSRVSKIAGSRRASFKKRKARRWETFSDPIDTHIEPELPPSRPRGYRYVVRRGVFGNNWDKYAVGQPSRLAQPTVCETIPEAPEEAELEVVEVEPCGIVESPEHQEEFPLVDEDVDMVEDDTLDETPDTVTVEEDCGPSLEVPATYDTQLGSVFVEGRRRSSRHLPKLGSISDSLGRRRSARLSAL